jgi:hypothetical protein
MSFLRRLRRDKDGPPPSEPSKEEPEAGSKEVVPDDEVRVYGADERPLPPRRPKPGSRVDPGSSSSPSDLKNAASRNPRPAEPPSPDSRPTEIPPTELPRRSAEGRPLAPVSSPGSTPPIAPTSPPSSPSSATVAAPRTTSSGGPSGPASLGPPPPLPERGPVHPREGARPPGADGSCFVCGTVLEGRYCSVCRMTWVE